MTTQTHEPLFLAAPDLSALFEKQASIAKMPDDERRWPAQVLSELHKQLPFLSDYDVDIELSQVESEAGYGLGYAMVRNRLHSPRPEMEVAKAANRLRIPIIVADRRLQPFHTFELGGTVYPLTAVRVKAAMLNPAIFAGPVENTPGSPSLVDQIYPPFQQRQGFGMTSDKSVQGIGKISSAPSLCAAIAGTINPTDFARFEAVFQEPVWRRVIEKNASVIGALTALTSRPMRSSTELAKIANREASAQRLDVVQVTPCVEGYRVKFSSAPHNMAPITQTLSFKEAMDAFPVETLQTANQMGAATVTTVPQAPVDTMVEQMHPVDSFGLYKVMEQGSGKEVIGYVIPGLLDPRIGQPSGAMLFVNGSQFALQEHIAGSLVGVNHNLPSSTRVRGLGIFYKTDGKSLTATVPFEIMTEVTVGPRKYYAARTQDGQEIQLVLSEGLVQPTMISPQEIAIPREFLFMPLDNPIALEAGAAPSGSALPMKQAQADAWTTMAEIRAWRDHGCDLRGPVFDKIGSGHHSWVDGVFWLAATGVPQNLAVELLEKAAESGQPLRLFGLHPLRPYESTITKAASLAVEDMRKLRIPDRVNLLKEAAALADTASVDSVLALNFVNPENIEMFVAFIPQLEEAATKLAGVVLAAQLGLQSVPQSAAVKAMFATEKVIDALKDLQTHSL